MENTSIENQIYERHGHDGSIDSFFTKRETGVEIFKDQKYGYICLMDAKVQSATSDEEIYHDFLASLGFSPHILTKDPQRVLIVGSGEGCLAREVLRNKNVKEVVMVDWDIEVIEAFRTRWCIWAGKSTWEDPRLRIEIADIWELLDRVDNDAFWKFDCILVDLFDPGSCPDEIRQWEKLMTGLSKWLNTGGSLAAYCGMAGEDVADETVACLSGGGMWRNIPIKGDADIEDGESILVDLSINKVYVPSFGGEAVFVSGKRV